ncbi:ATP-binding protein [Kribbella sp. NBC_00889]|uniref:ATP-binding protein n=1 Tax=Kribbella sp. NBC_00889 TaxID=2975974 RepID=UPI00386415C3|nr:ATP-binding protein [Kribbella sp. NBC_00889]
MSDAASSLLAPAESADCAANWRRPFQRLDSLLAAAVAEARVRFGAEAGRDSFRGLYITEELAAAALSGPLGEPLRTCRESTLPPAWAELASSDDGWAWLRRTYGLTENELDVVLIALAPEVDLRYERLYGYLQDDVSRCRATVNLILDLISTSPDEKLVRRTLFAADAPLLRNNILQLVSEERAHPPLLAQAVVLDEQITGVLLAVDGLDSQLAGYCQLACPPPARWAETALSPAARRTVLGAAGAAQGRYPLRIHLHGPVGSDRAAAAVALAGELRAPILTLRAADLPTADEKAALVVARSFREALLKGAVLFVDGESFLPVGSRARSALVDGLAEHGGITVLAGTQPWTAEGGPPLGVLNIAVGRADLATRRAAWARELDEAGTTASTDLVDTLAGRFSFGPAQIAEAVASAATAAGADRGPTAKEVFAGARRQTSQRLAVLARRIEPTCTWADIVLPPDTTAQLKELCARVGLRSTVLTEWGFEQKLARGRGTTALFTGPPGTGKTTAAEVVAGELGLDLFAIDLSAVVSKYIGETEKNLETIFAAAADADAILLFDEADALFGKRSEVHDAHDRYANIETSYLLQRMEQYDGIAVLATNLRQNLDEAFTRRLQFIVEFPFPDDELREGIWRIAFPPGAPLAETLDVVGLAHDFRLSGANIRNAALHSAFLAAARSESIGTAHVRQAIWREFQKMGRVPPGATAEQVW